MFASNPHSTLSACAESDPVRMPGTATASPVCPMGTPPWRLGLKIGRVMIGMNRSEEALPLFKKALEVDPDNANAYVQLGRAFPASVLPRGLCILDSPA